jgi:hypothetical protein
LTSQNAKKMSLAALPWPDMDPPCGTKNVVDDGVNPQEDEDASPQRRQPSPNPKTTTKWGRSHSLESDSDGERDDLLRTAWGAKRNPNIRTNSQPNSPILIYGTEPASGGGDSGNTNPNQGYFRKASESCRQTTESESHMGKLWERANGIVSPTLRCNIDVLTDYVGDACTPWYASSRADDDFDDDISVVGVSRMTPPRGANPACPRNHADWATICSEHQQSDESTGTAADRRKVRHQHRQKKADASDIGDKGTCKARNTSLSNSVTAREVASCKVGKMALVSEFKWKDLEPKNLDRTISELTMRSSYGGYEASQSNLPDNRRMAYYAVGKHQHKSSRGGNRRCYFSGKLILGDTPFYAGTVLQGLRTLVVFCLPSAIGLPDNDTILKRGRSASTKVGSSGKGLSALTTTMHHSPTASKSNAGSSSDNGCNHMPPSYQNPLSRVKHDSTGVSSVASQTAGSKSLSKFSLDDISLSVDGDLDPNWRLDRDFLLTVLPEANERLLLQIKYNYPEQFETLPVQVREASRWNLYVKFCFFSGLPIADGEMHYKVSDKLAESTYGEEIVLSYEVMEAVNGASADILTLPNTKAFSYLRRHYSVQCKKLDDRLFQRSSWERVAPEV